MMHRQLSESPTDHPMEHPIHRVVVLGASSGIGAAVLDAQLREGRSVTGAARRAEQIAERIAGVGTGTGNAVRFDFAESFDHAALEQLLGEEPIDLLVNSAGLIRHDADLADDAARATFLRVNLEAPLILMRTMSSVWLAPHGMIVNISSAAATEYRNDLLPDPETGRPRWEVLGKRHPGFDGEELYGRSKYLLSEETKKFDAALIARGLRQRAFSIEPGLLKTEEAMKQFAGVPGIDWDAVPGPERIAAVIDEIATDPDAFPSIVPVQTYRF